MEDNNNGNGSRTAVILVRLPLSETALRTLAKSSDIRVVGAAQEPEPALGLIAHRRPSIFIAEIDDEDAGNNLEVIRKARKIDSGLKVIVLAKERSRSSIVEAFDAGADIYVFNDADPDDLVTSMRQLFNQSFYIAAHWRLPEVPLANGMPALTRREFEVLKLVGEGHTNGIMASMLSLTEQTIKFHLSNIYRKLDVANRTEASRWAQLHGLLPLSETTEDPVSLRDSV